MDTEKLVTAGKPYVRMEISSDGFFKKSLFSMGGQSMHGITACVRALLGCRMVVSGAADGITALLMPVTSRLLPTEDDIRTVFPQAQAVTYHGCEPPPRLESFITPHVQLNFKRPVREEVVPDKPISFLDGVGREAVWDNDPDSPHERVLALWHKKGMPVTTGPRHGDIVGLLADAGWEVSIVTITLDRLLCR